MEKVIRLIGISADSTNKVLYAMKKSDDNTINLACKKNNLSDEALIKIAEHFRRIVFEYQENHYFLNFATCFFVHLGFNARSTTRDTLGERKNFSVEICSFRKR